MNNVTSSSIYYLSDKNQEILLSLSSGKGQATVSSIVLDHSTINDGIEGNYKTKSIGMSDDLRNKFLSVNITVQDVNPDTNATHVTVSLTGGREDIAKTFDEVINADGGQIFYHISFFLK